MVAFVTNEIECGVVTYLKYRSTVHGNSSPFVGSIVNPRRACAVRVMVLGLSVCQSARWILTWRFSWNDCVLEIWRENKQKSQRAVDRTRALSGRLYSAHASWQLFAGACAMPRRLYDLRASVSFDLCSLCFQWIDKHAEQGMFAM